MFTAGSTTKLHATPKVFYKTADVTLNGSILPKKNKNQLKSVGYQPQRFSKKDRKVVLAGEIWRFAGRLDIWAVMPG